MKDNILKIESIANPKIKSLKKLQDKKNRKVEKKFLIEGVRLIEEAIRQNAKIKTIIFDNNKEIANTLINDIVSKDLNLTIIESNQLVLKHISETENNQGIVAEVEMPEDQEIDFESYILYLDHIQDPGNLGTIIRSCHAFNIRNLVLSQGTVDQYSDKVLRSSMGSIFSVNIRVDNSERSILNNLVKNKYSLYITEFTIDSKNIKDVVFNDKSVIIIGNEANGVSNDILKLKHEPIIIPMPGKSESLNAAVASSIILYEIRR